MLTVGATELQYSKQTNIKRRWGLHKHQGKCPDIGVKLGQSCDPS